MSGFPTGHCRHCWGNCSGTCMLPGLDVCIHDVHRSPHLPLPARLRAIRTRRFWRRLFYGIHAH
jgi:hypothetical protein